MYDLIISHLEDILANMTSSIRKQELLDELFDKLECENLVNGREVKSPYSILLPDGKHTEKIDFLIKGIRSENDPLDSYDPFETIEAVFDVICEDENDDSDSLLNECLNSLSKVFDFEINSDYLVLSAGVICILHSADEAKRLEQEIIKQNKCSFAYRDIYEDAGDFCILAFADL